MSSGNPTDPETAPASAAQASAAATTPATTVRDRPGRPLLFSFGLHLILLVVLAWFAARVPKGSGGADDRPIGIAVVHRLPDRDRYAEVTTTEPVNELESASAAASAAAAPPADLSPPIDLQGILAAMQSTPAPVSGTGIAGDVQLDGNAFGDGNGSATKSSTGDQATARMFGVSGSGTRFVYVLDRSDSMNGFGGLPLRSAKRELIRSLRSLSPQQQFQIIFYNENVKPFQTAGTSLSLISGESTQLKRAERYIESIQAFGGTKHKGALLMALRMSPDVIFFLTDAHIPRLSRLELQEVQDRAERGGTTIHAIEFGSQGSPAADNFLKELAAMNNGQYQYVDVRNFSSDTLRSDDPDAATDSQTQTAEAESL